MNSDALRDQVKRYYEKQNMSPDKAARLAAMLRAAGHPGELSASPGFKQRIGDWFASLGSRFIPAAATAMVILIILNAGVWHYWRNFSENKIHIDIAREIAMNHVKNLSPEYQAISIETLARVMPALDFIPYTPKMMNQMGLELKGARYCSIQGHLAVQIKLRDSAGQRYTIYEAPHLPPLQNIPGTRMNLDGLQITMWNEHGVFIGMAGPIADNLTP